MQKISGAGNVNNRFVAENVNTGQAPTQITADWMNAVQDELVNVVLGAGFSLDANNNAQVLAAINKLVNAAVVPTGTIFPYTGSATVAPAGYIFGGSILSRATYADLFALWVTNQPFVPTQFTCSIASPGVFNKAEHGFTGGERLRLATTGALPTGLNTTSDFFVERIDADKYYLTTSVFGIATRVATTGSQSGTHTYLQSLYGLGDGFTTFYAPDARGLFIRDLDGGRGIDANRALGTTQKGTLYGFDTNTGAGDEAVQNASTSQSTTLATAQISIGADAYTVTNYPFCNIPGVNKTNTYLLPGVASSQSASGIMRPSNIALPHIIKY